MAEGIHKCEPDDPNRCQAVGKRGQCQNKGADLPGGKFATYCRVHGGNRQQEAAQRQELRTYDVAMFQARIDAKRKDPNIKNLRDDIAILRMLMEQRLNSCQSDADLLINSGPLLDLSSRIERIVLSCHKLEAAMGQYLDKQQVLEFATAVIKTISTHIKDPDILKNISADLSAELWRLENASQTNGGAGNTSAIDPSKW